MMLAAVLIPTGMINQDPWAHELGAGGDGVDTPPDLRASVIIELIEQNDNGVKKCIQMSVI